MATINIKTVTEAAVQLGLTPGRIRQICIKHDIGEMHGSIRFLTPEDVEKIQANRHQESSKKKSKR